MHALFVSAPWGHDRKFSDVRMLNTCYCLLLVSNSNSGFNTDYGSSEPLKTPCFVMLCYVNAF